FHVTGVQTCALPISSAWEFDTNSMRPVPKVDADTKDARAKADRWKFDTNSMRPVPVVDANIFPARLKAAGWRTWADALSASPVRSEQRRVGQGRAAW